MAALLDKHSSSLQGSGNSKKTNSQSKSSKSRSKSNKGSKSRSRSGKVRKWQNIDLQN